MQLLSFQQLVLVIALISQALLLVKMWREQLASRYPFLTAFLLGACLQAALALPFYVASKAYMVVDLVTSPILWFLEYLVVLELYRLILEDYPGISTVGQRGMTWSMILAVAIAAGFGIHGSLHSTGSYRSLRVFLAVERSAVLGLLVFLVLIQVFLFRYHLRLSRNRMLYSIGYAAYFAIGIAADIIDVQFLGERSFQPVSWACSAIANVLLLAGAFLLNRQGEETPAFEEAGDDADRQRLQKQLNEMNAMLTRVARAGRG